MTPGLSAALADRYRLERELGQGGMATVYLAHDLILVTVTDAPAAAPAGVTGSAAVPASRYLVVLNWFAELKALTKRDGR